MNRVYRLIWSRLREAWVVVSEAVRGSGGAAPVTVGNLLAAALLASSAGTVYALPTSPTVVSGTAGIVSSGGTMTITNSANAIINWQGFSIGQGETARFIQPSALSAVLNRVTGGDPSKILGALQSNGKVLLINPNGILFGPNSRVDVNGLIASTLTITNEDFLAGRMKFSAGPTAGKVENRGSIATPSGGGVYLIAPAVENSGVITAPNGDVLLAAGKEVLLVDRRSPEIAVVVTAPAGESLNLGTIVADAGRIGMYGSVVRQKGRISANSAVQDAQGRIFLKSSGETTVASGSVTSADGSGTASGGKVIVWSDGATVVDGTISAKGGEQGGNGGFVETSGTYLKVADTARISTIAANGRSGIWLLDPNDFTIAPSGGDMTGATLATNLNSGNIVIETAVMGTAGNGDIFVNDAIAKTGTADTSLTLKAERSISINAPISSSGGKLDVVLNAHAQSDTAPGSVWINKNITTNGGSLIVGGGLDPAVTAAIGYGSATNDQLYGVYVETATISTGGGNIIIRGQGVAGSPFDADGINLANTVQLHAQGGNITLAGRTGDQPTIGTIGTAGIYSDAVIDTTGSGAISLTGRGGLGTGKSNIRGINLSGGTIRVENGTLSIIGYGGDATGSNNKGVRLHGSLSTPLQLQSTGSGSISITGGPCPSGCINTPTSNNEGVLLNSQYVTVVSAGGTISITGIGTGTGSGNSGVSLLGSITAGTAFGAGAITISGTGSAGSAGIQQSGSGTLQAAALATSSVRGTLLGNVNQVASYSASNLTSGDITFNNAATTLTLSGANINNNGGGNVTITNAGTIRSVGWVQTSGNGSISLSATGGSAIIGNALISGNDNAGAGAVSVIASGTTSDIELNTTNIYSGATGGGSGAISLTAGRDVKLNPAAVSTTGSVTVQGGQNVLLNGPITAGSVHIDAAAGGSISGTGTISAPSVNLQHLGGGSMIGVANAPLKTSGASSISVGFNAAGPGAVYLDHTGSATLQNLFTTGTATPIAISATQDITATSMGAGTADLKLTAGNQLTLPSLQVLSGGNVTLTANRVAMQANSGINAIGGTVWIKSTDSARGIDLGSTTDLAATSLELSSSELNSIVATAVRIGTTAGGNLVMTSAIAPTGFSTLSLESGGTVTQEGAGTLSIANLAIQALGAVDLSAASNSVTNLAASIGNNANPNKNFTFRNNAPLNVGTVAGIAGISTYVSGIYNTEVPDGIIALTGNGALTQSTGALLGGKAVYAKGDTVSLSLLNPTGIIAGEATGGSFQYTSGNGIWVTTVAGAPGIQNTGTGGNIALTGSSIAQDALISTRDVTGGGGFNLSLVSSGPVSLRHAGNNVSSISADLRTGSGSLSFLNNADLTTGSITTNGNYVDIGVPTANQITVSGSIATGTGESSVIKLSGGGITYASSAVTNSGIIALQSTDPAKGITLSGGVLGAANTGVVEMTTDRLTLSGGTVVANATNGAISISPHTANTPIVVGTGGAPGTLYISDTSITTFNAPDFAIGSIAGNPSRAVSGAISVETAIARAGKRVGLFSGAGITQVASIIADSLGVIAGGPVNLNTSNQVHNLAIETNSGAIDFTNSSALTITALAGGAKNPSAITGVTSIGGGNIQVTASAGTITLASPVVTDTTDSTVILAAPGGAIVDAVASGAGVAAKDLALYAATGIGSGFGGSGFPLKTRVSMLTAENTGGSGDINIVNSGALTTSGWVSNGNPANVSGGRISIIANSPLTIAGSGGIAALNEVWLEAGATGGGIASDILTIDGDVFSGTNKTVTLRAGSGIVENGTVRTAGGIVRQAHLNGTPSCSTGQAWSGSSCAPIACSAGYVLVGSSCEPITCSPGYQLAGSICQPTISTCAATPILPGCSTVLPSLDTCIAAPSITGCSVVLPMLAICTTAPSTPGCSVVLPSLETCITTPSAAGCSAVVPSLADCTASPAMPGCSAVLPTLATCTSASATPGCSVVLPSLAACVATPAIAGCSAVLPALADCAANPSRAGCVAVVPVQEQGPLSQAVNQVVNAVKQMHTTPVAPTGVVLVSLAPAGNDAEQSSPATISSGSVPAPSSGSPDSGDSQSSGNTSGEKDKGKDKQNDQQPAGREKKDEKPKNNYCN
ncbi:two-partner secretion domain-containing protein [Trichlorobacter ammonificans]|uniref:Haemagg_act domain-containing protein n=1 Tax=Trichlorobacter ammonificans TaxID=2916410 RepID=A0ABM9DBM8_9BACT|nr:filamentous hemagglutinin N-terminal domain-containing protein [Trichlorobacter ammonificans]CAH2032634.1 putative Haemagg_act domain-containing protein [Trichlorobacter ammonificans]